jgi:hypothetical protein
VGHLSDEVTSDYVHLAQSTIASRLGKSSLVQSLSAPKQLPAQRAHEPMAHAYKVGSLDPPLPSSPAPRNRVSELLTGLDANERRALLKALLNSDAA